MNRRHRTLPRHLALSLLLFTAPSAAAQETHVFEGEELPLELDPARIALFGPDPEGGLARLGIEGAELSAWPIPGWTVVELPEGLDEESEVRELIPALAADEEALRFAAPIFVGADGGPVWPTPELLVRFEEGTPAAWARALLSEAGAGQILEEQWAGSTDAYRAAFDSRDGFEVLAVARALALSPSTRYAEPDMVFTGHGTHTPSDPDFWKAWGLQNTGQWGGTPDFDMDATEAWDTTLGDASIEVVVLDSGVQQDHPDLHQIPGADLTSDGPGSGGPVNAWDNHGTAVAGCVSAAIDNGLGTVGVAPGCVTASARTMITTSPSGTWTSQSSWTVDALAFAESLGARITNNSNGYGFTSAAIADKYLTTRLVGMIHFAAAGNYSTAALAYPALLSSVHAVAALDRNGGKASFSNWGTGLAFSTPGEDIYCLDRTGTAGYSSGDYVMLSGTSFASPYAAGVAALLLSVQPELDAWQVEIALAEACEDLGPVGYDTTHGYGALNARLAVARCGGESYCNSLPNSSGFVSELSWSGSTSLGANDLVLRARYAVPGQFGIFFYGPNQVDKAFGDGRLCVQGGFYRMGAPRQLDAAGDVQLAVDLSKGPMAAGPGQIGADTSWNFQFWYRDPLGAGGSGFNTSSALELRFCP